MKWINSKKININLVNKLLDESLKTNQFTNYGPNVQYLEKYIKDLFEISDDKSIICVTNGSVALHSLTTSISYTDNKKINWATQSFTFPPSAQSTLSNVKIIDIDEDGGMDLNLLDNNIDGIIVTNIFGNIVDINKYEEWASNNNKYLIFDNAATCYTFYKGKNCLNYGHGCTISFHHTKPFGFGEGGAIIVDKKYEKAIRHLNNFGINLTDKYWLKEGNNNKMSDISAVYIIQFLKNNFKTIISKHMELYNYFKFLLKKNNIKHFKLFSNYYDIKTVVSCISILYNEEDINDSIIDRLNKNNIFARKYYHPLNNDKKANNIYKRIVCIPCNIDMNNNDIDLIFNLL